MGGHKWQEDSGRQGRRLVFWKAKGKGERRGNGVGREGNGAQWRGHKYRKELRKAEVKAPASAGHERAQHVGRCEECGV